MIHLPAQIYYQYQHKEHDCRCSVQIAVDKHYRLIHGCTSKTQFRPGRFTEIQRRAFYFLLVLAFGFQLCDSAVSTLPLGHARHNAGIFQTVFVQVALQVWVKIAQFTAVKNIVRTDLIALLVLRVFDNGHETKMQMWLAALVIMDDGLHDIFIAIAICQEIVCCVEKVIVALWV